MSLAYLRVDVVREEVCVRPPVHELRAVHQRGLRPGVDDGRVLALAGPHALLLRGADLIKVARWQNLIPSFPWIAPGWRAWGGAIQGKEGIKFCSVA